MKTRTFMIFVSIGLGLGACSNAALKDQTSLTSGSLSQTNEATTTGVVSTNDSHISSFFDITYFDFDSAELSADTRKVLNQAVDKFLTNPSRRVVISGHADEVEIKSISPRAVFERANNILKAQGIVVEQSFLLRLLSTTSGSWRDVARALDDFIYSKAS